MKNIVWSLRNKMDNPTFVGEDTIPMVHQDEDYIDYRTPDGRDIIHRT